MDMCVFYIYCFKESLITVRVLQSIAESVLLRVVCGIY